MDKYFVVQILKKNGNFTNNVHVKDNADAAMHQYHAFMSTYAYGQDAQAEYAACYVIAPEGAIIEWKIDDRTSENAGE